MNKFENQLIEWRQSLDCKLIELLSAAAQVHSILKMSAGSEDGSRDVYLPYLEAIRTFCVREYTVLEAFENSDFVISITDCHEDEPFPRISLLSSYLEKIRRNITLITKALLDLDGDLWQLLTPFEMMLSGFSNRKTFIGFSLPSSYDLLETSRQFRLFGDKDLVFKAAQNGIKTLGQVCQLVEHNASIHRIAEVIPDGRVRDASLMAVAELAPTENSGVREVSIGGSLLGKHRKAILTARSRERALSLLREPVTYTEWVKLRGVVRQVDLDLQRFEIVHRNANEIVKIRCIYEDFSDDDVASLLNKNVLIKGSIERTADGRPRLLHVSKIEY